MDIEDDKTAIEDAVPQTEKDAYSVDELIEKLDDITCLVELALLIIMGVTFPFWLGAFLSDDVSEGIKAFLWIVIPLIVIIYIILSSNFLNKHKLFQLIAAWIGFLALYTCIVIFIVLCVA